MNSKIRLRYAPSPTGYLHIGNTRTALFNYLMAKHYEGTFIVRIEDTDIERNVPGAIESQFDNLNWLGIQADESLRNPNPKYGPYTQLERLEEYNMYAQQLLASKQAYYCFCTSEELEASREAQIEAGHKSPRYDRKCWQLSAEEVATKLAANIPANIRFYVPANRTYAFEDMVRGHVSFESKDMGDWVIIKSNGIPTYNFAVVVDDFKMEISHVVRGEEHISNTPKQLMIFEAFGWTAPIYGHLTLIVNEQRKKLSKRDGNVMQFISQYRETGYLPEAMFNFISLLGWSPSEEKEIFSPSDLIRIFDEHRWSKSPSMFDVKKLQWMNGEYIKKMTPEAYLAFVRPFLAASYDLSQYSEEWVNLLLLTFQKELMFGAQITDLTAMFFTNTEDAHAKEVLSELTVHPELKATLIRHITNLTEYTPEQLKAMIKQIGQELQIKGKDLFMPIRIFTTHQSHGPELNTVLFLLGKEKVLTHINQY